MKNQHAIILGVLAGVALVGMVVLYAIGRPVPDALSTVTIVGVSALAGLAIPASLAGAPPSVATLAQTPTTTAPAAGVVDAPQRPPQDAPRSPEGHETAPPGTVTPGMTPVQARIAGGS